MFNLITDKLEEINYSTKVFPPIKEKKPRKLIINSVVDLIYTFTGSEANKTIVVETTSHFDINKIEERELKNLVSLKRINDSQYLNKFFETINKKLPIKGIFICCAETKEQRYRRIINKYSKVISYPYYILDFILKRLFPKWGPTHKIYYLLTKGNNRVLSLSSILGMLVFNGFIVNYLKHINNLTYFVAEKISEPLPDCKPSNGILFKMKRIGENGKTIWIYKLRTMHPYSEYIQDFVYNLNGSGNGDKITNDFRVASWGKFLRKYWLDELPMLINFLKGDVKLVGVRPLSCFKFNQYPIDLQKLRISAKPGLVPPFYKDLPRTFDELLESERKYLVAYKKKPVKTDFKYFFKCFYNIIIKHARSS